jgi:HAE1 family hydrophobic/amphiphilic exporter-1
MKAGMPQDYTAKLTGENQQMKDSFQSLQFALILSLVLVYMVMAAEFESLWQPFVILFAFPLSIIGVVISLWVTHTSLSVMVILGIIILGGIVVNNGIVLIEYVNILRERDGFTLYDALIEASHTRLRPIIMTALTTSLGLIPLAIGLSEGAEIQIPMAVTVMGGLLFSTFLSLIIIPAIYISFENFLVSARSFISAPLAFFRGAKVPVTEEAVYATAMEEERKPTVKPYLETEPVIYLPQKPHPRPSLPTINLPHNPLPEANEETRAPEEKSAGEINALPGKYLTLELAKREKELILYLLENKRITRPEYMHRFNVSVATAARDLRGMLDKGVLKALGPKAIGRYYELL